MSKGIDFNTASIWDKINSRRAAARKAKDKNAVTYWTRLAGDFDRALAANDREMMLMVSDYACVKVG